MTDPNAWTHQGAEPPREQEPAPTVWAGQPPPQQQDHQGVPVGGQPSLDVAPAVVPTAASSGSPVSAGPVEHGSTNQLLWEYKVISATFGSELETKLNTWGANGWEVISIAGMNGTVTLTGNKIFVVLKRRSLRHEAVAATAADYLETLRNHYGPALFDQLENRHGRELMERAARALVWVGQQPNNPLGVLDHACELMAESNYERDGWAIRQAWSDTEGQPVPE